MRARAMFACGLFAIACGGAVEDRATQGGGPDAAAKAAPASSAIDAEARPAPTFKRVFVTSVKYTGNLGGVTGADEKCQALATNARLTGTFKAWISDSLGSSPSTTFTRSTIPYGLSKNRIVADSWTDLTDGTLQRAIDRDERGRPVKAETAAGCTGPSTGTSTDGTAAVWISARYNTCLDWTSDDATDNGLGGVWGDTTATNAAWTSACSPSGCAATHRLYCFEQ